MRGGPWGSWTTPDSPMCKAVLSLLAFRPKGGFICSPDWGITPSFLLPTSLAGASCYADYW